MRPLLKVSTVGLHEVKPLCVSSGHCWLIPRPACPNDVQRSLSPGLLRQESGTLWHHLGTPRLAQHCCRVVCKPLFPTYNSHVGGFVEDFPLATKLVAIRASLPKSGEKTELPPKWYKVAMVQTQLEVLIASSRRENKGLTGNFSSGNTLCVKCSKHM